MANASRDQNNVTTIIGALNTDGVTPIRVKANPVNHALKANFGNFGTDYGNDIDPRDENSVPVFMAVSEVDGVTPVPIYASSTGSLMLDLS